MSARDIAALRRKLHAWELEHLRQVVAEQQQRIEALAAVNVALCRELRETEAIAEQWQSEAEALREDVGARGGQVHLFRDVSMSIVYGAREAA